MTPPKTLDELERRCNIAFNGKVPVYLSPSKLTDLIADARALVEVKEQLEIAKQVNDNIIEDACKLRTQLSQVIEAGNNLLRVLYESTACPIKVEKCCCDDCKAISHWQTTINQITKKKEGV